MEYGFETVHQDSESSCQPGTSMLQPCALTKTLEETVIIRVICLPLDSVQDVSADEAHPKSLAGTNGRRAKSVNRIRCPTNLVVHYCPGFRAVS